MNSAAVATITPARKSETPKVEETKVKSSAEYLKEFNEFYNDKVEIKIEEKEEEKYEKEKELKEKELKKEEFVEEEFEEETEDEVKEKKEEEEDKDGKLCAAPKVKPYMAPPNPLDLYEDLEDALTAAEDRIGKLKAEKAVFEARLARQDELIAELLQHKAASYKRFEELESALADHNTRAASRSSMRPPPSTTYGVRKESGRMSELKMAKNTMFVTTKARKIKQNLRPIVIDGSNVAMSHGRNKFFSCRGIEMVSEHFTKLGHKTIAFVPQFRNLAGRVKDPKVI